MDPESRPSSDDQATVQARAVRLAMGVIAPYNRLVKLIVLGFAAAAVVGLLVGLVTRQPALGGVAGLAVAVLVALPIGIWFADTDYRAAVELFYDHDCHERAEWKAKTGTSVPRGFKGIEKWLAAHPDSPGRASMLLLVGRLDEADRAIEVIEATTPEEAFAVDIMRATRALLAGNAPNVAALHERWRSLPDPRERRHQRECLAMLDAQIAVDQGRDAVGVLAIARREVGEVYRTMRAPWLIAKWFALGVLAVATSTLFAVWIVG